MARTEYEPHSKKYFLELSARLESYAKRYKEVADKLTDEQMLICPYRKTLNEALVNLQLHWTGTESAFYKVMDAILMTSFGKCPSFLQRPIAVPVLAVVDQPCFRQ